MLSNKFILQEYVNQGYCPIAFYVTNRFEEANAKEFVAAIEKAYPEADITINFSRNIEIVNGDEVAGRTVYWYCCGVKFTYLSECIANGIRDFYLYIWHENNLTAVESYINNNIGRCEGINIHIVVRKNNDDKVKTGDFVDGRKVIWYNHSSNGNGYSGR